MVPKTESPTPDYDEQAFVAASDSLQELLSRSALSDGAGTKTVTEPLLLWLDRYGNAIVQATITSSYPPGMPFSPSALAARTIMLIADRRLCTHFHRWLRGRRLALAL